MNVKEVGESLKMHGGVLPWLFCHFMEEIVAEMQALVRSKFIVKICIYDARCKLK